MDSKKIMTINKFINGTNKELALVAETAVAMAIVSVAKNQIRLSSSMEDMFGVMVLTNIQHIHNEVTKYRKYTNDLMVSRNLISYPEDIFPISRYYSNDQLELLNKYGSEFAITYNIIYEYFNRYEEESNV